MKVAWFALEDLGALARRHRAHYTVTRGVDRILRSEQVVVDERRAAACEPGRCLWPLPPCRRRLSKRSMAISSKPEGCWFDELTPKTLAGATADRAVVAR